MAKLSNDRKSGTRHPRENILGSGTLASANAEVIIDCDGASSFQLDLRGNTTASFEVSGTTDNVNWTPIPVRPVNQASVLYLITLTFAGAITAAWAGECVGYDRIRIRNTAFTSGTVTAALLATNAPLPSSLQNLITPGVGTNVGAAGAALTLTLAAPGVGLRHYLTYLSITRFASALLTAAAAPVTVTTTNLPGSLALSFPAEAAAQGTVDRWREDFAYPIAASAQNTATTIVCPLTTGVIWRATAGFYVAP